MPARGWGIRYAGAACRWDTPCCGCGRPAGIGATPGGLPPVRARHARRPGNGELPAHHSEIQIGMIHARQTVSVTAEDDRFSFVIDDETGAVVPRTTTREVHRHQAYATQKTSGSARDQA